MGFFDVGPYDNDYALDWLADQAEVDNVDALVDALCRETERPDVMDADAAAYALATVALLLDFAEIPGYRPPDVPLPALRGQAVAPAQWRRLSAILDRVAHSELFLLLQKRPESQALWLENVARINAHVAAMCGPE